eukprot:556301_1
MEDGHTQPSEAKSKILIDGYMREIIEQEIEKLVPTDIRLLCFLFYCRNVIDVIMGMHIDDLALTKYKQSLLGNAVNEKQIIDIKDKRIVLFDELIIKPSDGMKPISIDPTKCDANTIAFTLKEKAKYRIIVKFRVQKEIVSGLKEYVVVKRKGITVDKYTNMIGSYAPAAHRVNEHIFPEQIVPSGMLVRGIYIATTQFIDDENTVHLEFSYKFKIAKKWK